MENQCRQTRCPFTKTCPQHRGRLQVTKHLELKDVFAKGQLRMANKAYLEPHPGSHKKTKRQLRCMVSANLNAPEVNPPLYPRYASISHLITPSISEHSSHTNAIFSSRAQQLHAPAPCVPGASGLRSTPGRGFALMFRLPACSRGSFRAMAVKRSRTFSAVFADVSKKSRPASLA